MKTEAKTSNGVAPISLVITAFAAVYIIWGSTYLGIRYAVESIPPFMMAGSRNLAAGLLMFAFARLRGGESLRGIQWRDAAIAGGLMLVLGNGGVTWAERLIPSGAAALLVGLTPVWMVLFDWLRPNGVRPSPIVGLGLLTGFLGVALLARNQGNGGSSAHVIGVVVLISSSVAWALGSLFNRSANKPASPALGVSMQLIAGGTILLILSLASGEFKNFSFAQVTPLSFGAWLYLVVAGSIIGYTAYVWLLHVTTPARVSTYAYVNPLIAVLLGCTIGHEAFSHEMFIAGAMIIIAVVLVLRGGAANGKKPQPALPQKILQATE